MRPCAAAHPDPRPADCHLCRLFVTDPRYRGHWSAPPARVPPPAQPAPPSAPPQDDDPVRIVYCAGRDTWDWAVLYSNGTVAISGSVRGKENRGLAEEEIAQAVMDLIAESGPAEPDGEEPMGLVWAYGVTTVPQRRADGLLVKTLNSLKAAGFDRPRLFVDGCKGKDVAGWEAEFGLEVTPRWPVLRTAGNWVLSLYELYLRQPDADRYALFQDDVVLCRNVRAYIEKGPWPGQGYLNLYTMHTSEHPFLGVKPPRPVGWYEGSLVRTDRGGGQVYHGKPIQRGLGACALVFDRAGVQAIVGSAHLAERPVDVNRGHRSIDGGIVTAMNKAGFREYVHNPSLAQHTGMVSAMGNMPHPQSHSFRGEEFDAITLLAETGVRGLT